MRRRRFHSAYMFLQHRRLSYRPRQVPYFERAHQVMKLCLCNLYYFSTVSHHGLSVHQYMAHNQRTAFSASILTSERKRRKTSGLGNMLPPSLGGIVPSLSVEAKTILQAHYAADCGWKVCDYFLPGNMDNYRPDYQSMQKSHTPSKKNFNLWWASFLHWETKLELF